MSRELRVVHVVCAGEVGGAERMLIDLVGSPAERHHVALFSPSATLRAFLREHGVLVTDRGPVTEGVTATLARAVGRSDVAWLGALLARDRADVVHLHTFGSQVLGTRAALAARPRRAIVRTEHSTRVFDDPSCWPFARWSLPRADVSCAVSHAVRAEAQRRDPQRAARMRVVPNGVDLGAFSPLPTRPGLREVGSPRAAVVGRLEPRKGVDIVLHALARVPDLDLDVCGDGPDAPALRALARRLGLLGRVRFLGQVADVPSALRDVDVVVSGARKEGLGLALLEAMAVGRVVVATAVGGVPEFLVDGRTGFLAPSEDPTALAGALRKALAQTTEARDALVARARTCVVDTYSRDAMRAGYSRAYRDALARSHASK
ncbi:MAG: glycosyltransferase family 4 protein [Myxococcales bacterium]|nr:glycosyltransferase family 4 protein [Myxococcales bacterium]MBL0198078.1 glycosyltransferase family 4 protein [Myxococcales bacterium]HQY61584.1 glycosyltransferase family 4 protein [Polyangiaceae bacterium]